MSFKMEVKKISELQPSMLFTKIDDGTDWILVSLDEGQAICINFQDYFQVVSFPLETEVRNVF